jgi:hypothetical membrane protein
MGIITAETFYPLVYTTFTNEISDLGSTRPPKSLSFEPSATLFNSSMFLTGICILPATFFQHRHFKKLLFTIPLALFSLGLVGIGIFPGNVSPYHGMSSMLVFLSGGIAAITSFKIALAPFKYFGIVFGSIALMVWVIAMFFPSFLISSIGMGGTERWVGYPLMLWVTGLGGYLMNKNE